jgi:NDP-sugar pyrophosphorylase family protein
VAVPGYAGQNESSDTGGRPRHAHQRGDHLKPKPMVEIGGMPILWHIMKIYSRTASTTSSSACGYKGYLIKEYFANYFLHTST